MLKIRKLKNKFDSNPNLNKTLTMYKKKTRIQIIPQIKEPMHSKSPQIKEPIHSKI